MSILHIFRAVFAAAVIAASIPVQAAVAMAAAPVGYGNPEVRQINDRTCVDCGARQAGNDARIYFRGEHRAPDQLLAQVSYCSPDIGASYFPDEEEHIAAYLNKQYYRFK